MDETGRWRDNILIERLWRSLKYEEVYLHAYETVSDAHQRVTRYMVLASHGIALEGSSKMDTRLFHAWLVGYNTPPHSSLGCLIPNGVFTQCQPSQDLVRTPSSQENSH